MKKLIITSLLFWLIFSQAEAQDKVVTYDPNIQQTEDLQYFKPVGHLAVGDCMPFFHDGTFYVYWLVDSLHGADMNGLSGDQWALSTTKDLIHWKQYPIVIGIDQKWEKSICTGSVVYYNKKFYAFYATRLINDGKVNEQLSYAVSNDGIHFTKMLPNPFYKNAPGYSERNFRDPKASVDPTGTFHLFVASQQNNPVMANESGCLVHMVSKDLKHWTVLSPILTGQNAVPECPDYFQWNGWYYLLYNDNSNTFYVKSKSPYGPWQEPRSQALNEDWVNVVKTAAFIDGKRIAVGWIPPREGDKDNGRERFAGNMVFRELTQEPDGTLNTKFPPEMIPKSGEPLALKPKADLSAKILNSNDFIINAPNGIGVVHYNKVPLNCRITMEIDPDGINENYGVYLRSYNKAEGGYRLNFSSINQTVSLGNTSIHAVSGLDKDIKVDIIMKGDIIDVCVDDKRCIINRTPEQKGNFLWFYAKHGKVIFKSIKIRPLIPNELK